MCRYVVGVGAGHAPPQPQRRQRVGPVGGGRDLPKITYSDAGESAQNAAKVPNSTCSDAGESAQNAAKVPKNTCPDSGGSAQDATNLPKMYRPAPTP